MNDRALHRQALRRTLPDGLILLAGGVEISRNDDVNYAFRQNSNFLYLTGVPDPGYFLLLDPKRGRDTLFIPQVDTRYRVWEGYVPEPREARARYSVNKVRYMREIGPELKEAKHGYRKCYIAPDDYHRFSKDLKGLKNLPGSLVETLQELRACKTPGEIELLQKANDISGEGHRAVMAKARHGMREYELQAVFEGLCISRGLKHQGYPPIMAAGRNSAVLHYRHNDAVLKKGDWLLIDAGAECEGYSADITRTFPVGGRFNRRQKDVYSIVLEAQKQCIGRARARAISGELHLHSLRILAEGLRSLGLLLGSTDDLVTSGAIRLFYPHGLTHMLGLDVHDSTGGQKRHLPPPPNVQLRFNARLEPGFVVTMEPGIYFNPALINDKELRRKYRRQVNFKMAESFLDFGGVRIEDDVVVQPAGPPINLTKVPKEIPEVEAACGY